MTILELLGIVFIVEHFLLFVIVCLMIAGAANNPQLDNEPKYR